MKLDYVIDCACGVSGDGMSILPVIKIGCEERAKEIPREIFNTKVSVRFEKMIENMKNVEYENRRRSVSRSEVWM